MWIDARWSSVTATPLRSLLTQETLAHAARVDRTYISTLENGKASPTLETLFRLCDAIGISAAKVVGEVERHR